MNARIDDLTKENTDLKEKLAAIKTQQAEAAAAAATEKEVRIEFYGRGHQCDQIGQFIGLWATF